MMESQRAPNDSLYLCWHAISSKSEKTEELEHKPLITFEKYFLRWMLSDGDYPMPIILGCSTCPWG